MKIKFTTPFMGVVIEPDRLALYTVDPVVASVDIPMVYHEMRASIEGDIDGDIEGDDDACTSILLNIREKTMYLDDETHDRGPNRITIKVRNVDGDIWKDDYLHCGCKNADLCISVLEILSAIDYLDGEKLSTHGNDLAVIRNVSRTALLTARARAIIDRSYAGAGSAYRYEKIIRERRER